MQGSVKTSYSFVEIKGSFAFHVALQRLEPKNYQLKVVSVNDLESLEELRTIRSQENVVLQHLKKLKLCAHGQIRNNYRYLLKLAMSAIDYAIFQEYQKD